jgi:diguanylate cyclase (GGDEF)-like protein
MEPGTQVLGDVMSSFPMSRKSGEPTPADAGAKTSFEFLDSHAQVIEKLLPSVRAVAFFDTRGKPLRGRGPVPLAETRAQVRAALKSAAAGAGHPVESIFPVSVSERAASLVLYADSGASRRNRRSRTATGVCLIVLHVPDGAQPPSLDTLHVQLDPALDCVGYQLAQIAERVAPGHLPDDGANDLDWLFEISAPAVQGEETHATQDRGERLSTMMAASVAHLQSVLGALLVPERQLRIVRTADASRHAAEEALRHLESPMLNWVQRKNQPMVVNKPMVVSRAAVGSSQSPMRILAVPVTGHAGVPEGVLVLLRSTDAPEFSRAQLSLVKHLSRYISTLLETDFDVLTGLHTRSSAQGQVNSWERTTSPSSGAHSVICIDIDRLRVVNEMRGFDAGDALIVRVARLLRQPHLPPNAVVARTSGDEFAVALPHVDGKAATQTARALQDAAAQLSHAQAGSDEPVSLSCGVASFDGVNEFQSGLALAQLACQTAKDRGRGRVEIYQDSDASMILRQSDTATVIRLREALRNDDLMLFAQKIAPLQRQDDPEGYELLLRSMQLPQENHAPADLLSAALRNQLAPTLDMWVAEHALAQATPYGSALLAANVSLSINITGPSLTDETFLERVQRLIRGSRIAPSLITFEITETVAVLSLTKAVKFIRELRAMGCRFALDDFGTGTNSLKNLTSLPVDRVKLDGSYVSDILTNKQSVAMVRAIVSLTKDLGIGTVAEYAENARIIERLRELGVQYAQGYGVEKPRAFAEILNEVSTRESQKNFALNLEI